jgi:hypothetical protein
MKDKGFARMVEECDRQRKYTQYHEAGHAVAQYLLGFHPVRIQEASTKHDGRSSSFLRTSRGLFQTPRTRERAADFAVVCIAGPAAQAKVSDRKLCDLRSESELDGEDGHAGDYKNVYAILAQLVIRNDSVRDAQLNLWEQRAIAMINQPIAWAGVESVVNALELSGDCLERQELVSAIQRGLHNPSEYCESRPGRRRSSVANLPRRGWLRMDDVQPVRSQ